MANNNQLRFIGIVRSELKEMEDCPRQENENAPEATVEIFNEFAEGCENIQEGNNIILLTWLHEADRSILKTRPRNNKNLPLTGVFSTRSPDRPNPIGIHITTVTSIISGNMFKVSNLEVLDGTPVIDIKPQF